MFTSSVEVLISRPQDEVFAFVADARNRPSWDDSVDTEELTSPEPIGVGTTIRTTLRSMGRGYDYTWAVLEHEPPHRMVIESTSGPFPTTLAYHLTGQDGGTRVDFSVTGRPTGLLRLFQPLIARNTQRNLDRGFARLKDLLENRASGPVREAAGSFSRRALRGVFVVGGLVATTAGLDTVIRGARSLPRQRLANPSLESELRYYAGFYVAYGLAVLRVAPRADRDTMAVRALAGALLIAGLARAGGWLAVGRPHRLQRTLLAIELAAPPVIVGWQARLRDS